MAGLVACFVRGFKHISESLTLQISPFFKLLNYFCLSGCSTSRWSAIHVLFVQIRFYSVIQTVPCSFVWMPVLPLKSKLHSHLAVLKNGCIFHLPDLCLTWKNRVGFSQSYCIFLFHKHLFNHLKKCTVGAQSNIC